MRLPFAARIVDERFLHPPGELWPGFASGFWAALYGASIVFNLRGLMLWRRGRNRV